MQILSRPHAASLVEFGRHHPEVVVLSADLTASCEADDFRAAFPDRFFSLSMAEQNMVSMAGGLAREGFLPCLHTFAVFLTRRVFDQVAMSVAYPNLKVRFVGFLPGLTTPGGVTHQAVDDIALMRVIPNMTVVECGDATEVQTVLEATYGINGPVYIRQLRGDVPLLFADDRGLQTCSDRVLAGWNGGGLAGGGDILVISSGSCTEEAIRGRSVLLARGIDLAHVHVSTLKPFPSPAVAAAMASTRRVIITLENHSIIGGLGSAVAECMAESGSSARLVRLGLQDVYAHGASKPYLFREYGLDARALIQAVERNLGISLDVADSELLAIDPAVASGVLKVEDL